MTVENLLNIVRMGRQLTPAQSRAVSAQLERIPAMERTLAARDHDFAELSVAYSSARAECERLKEAVRAMLRAKAQGVSAYTAALKAVEELL